MMKTVFILSITFAFLGITYTPLHCLHVDIFGAEHCIQSITGKKVCTAVPLKKRDAKGGESTLKMIGENNWFW